ncbi:uncharacterized protein L969DRAFT_92023 [Mixia osmundae IAM 14324]|uniref:Saccharopine dehydrogenase [NAD(+), L-lysine-forming] n=1 Tax=Mixia osmundae (strain CBS 9802 / IAM 14324 / JCM 22182 / KY 12970) TaxID=764103 RepID=G7DZD8_MIXOS|nr:uncharacterized protein L969DRAFT_92023 [Mixia osmundae IAM 14324]KEI42587.1 hypothetical protein L969DRAFT_92023 [Mixia osmundae IAM 14324]GAA95948.1 hypothetical protein E5Q_02606 [Mixia osmundae IAM 14324]
MASTSSDPHPHTKSGQPIWLRAEDKPFEARAALTPTTAKQLLDQGWDVTVERDPQRIFEDKEYEDVGCTIVPHSSWTTAPHSVPILGLKELPVTTDPLPHTHVQFAHCYKQQAGWRDVLARFRAGGGTLLDLEFLQDERGRRVAAFGYHAGFAGAAVGCLALFSQVVQNDRLGSLKPYPNEQELIDEARTKIAEVKKSLGRGVRALVIGALGRCGGGAVSFLRSAGLEDGDILKWDMAETAKGGPFSEILQVDIFVNCIYLSSKIPHFVTQETIRQAGETRNLSVIVDVSADTTNPNNPIPVYDISTTFDKPTVDVASSAGPVLTCCSIDHLPTLLPREASEAFSKDLMPSLLQLPNRHTARVWTDAEKLFRQKLAEAEAAA